MGEPIYYIEARVSIIKNKNPSSRDVWIVSCYDNPLEIMRYDSKTIKRLQDQLYPPKAKNRTVLIEQIKSKKVVGTTSKQDKRS